ncbi:hypothetical protein BMS3Abin04_02094 [bacterium BMS3Abin04]|nr:hypothetical protein BMS3Abin04_02094 [bacterium BMS3Abin04]
MKKIFNIIFFLFVTIVVLSCDDLNEPGKIPIKNSFLYNVEVNAPKQEIFVYRTLDLSESIKDIPFEFSLKSYDKYFVENAEIVLSDQNENLSNFQIDKSQYGYRFYTEGELFTFKPETKYSIKVTANGQQFTGQTTTPGDFNILYPIDHDTLSYYEGIKIESKWTNSKNAKFYLAKLFIAAIDTFNTDEGQIITVLDFSRAIRTESIFNNNLSTNFNFSFRNRMDSIKIEILAFDGNYYNHIFNGYQSSGLENAFGYFGSSVLKSVVFYFK